MTVRSGQHTQERPQCVPLCGASKAYGKWDRPWHHELPCPVRIAWEKEREEARAVADVSLVDQHTNTVREALFALRAHDVVQADERQRGMESLAWLADQAGRADQLEQALRDVARIIEQWENDETPDEDFIFAADMDFLAFVGNLARRALAGGGQDTPA